jgi:hypothetical protein
MTDLGSSGGVAVEAMGSASQAHTCPGTAILDLLDWLNREPRTHRETIETWGSHCPRSTPWEDAQEAGLVQVTRSPEADGRLTVALTGLGHSALAVNRTANPVSPQT